MDEKSLSKETFDGIEEIDLPSIGLGSMRTSGTYIAALLQLESKGSRLGILVDIAKKLGFSLEQITDKYNDTMCSECGMSMYLHKYNNGGQCF